MKRIVLLLIICATSLISNAQTPAYTPVQWDSLKANGQIDNDPACIANPMRSAQDTMAYQLVNPYIPPTPAATSCQCWQERDANWLPIPCTNGSPPEYRNDDGSTGVINLPFTFCLYGQTWNQVYINNNGNVSFGGPYGTFTASGFPNNQFVMVAPFWADVDTRNLASGLPWYIITPTYMIVQWDSVGYYSSYADKLNSFQLIITDGSDPIVPGGNVSFCYQDMQWTTGDASGGQNGFQGSDAVVGANLGDGVNYIQFGAFNQPGGTYNGPQGANSGIDWLDYQTFIFDACTQSSNIPPSITGLNACDTLSICEGDTLPLNITFFAPEVGQVTSITVDTTGTTGYVEISNTPGNTAALVAYFLGSAANNGYNNITITATDNGVPAGTTVVPIVVQVLPAPVVLASSDTTICVGGSVNLNSSGATTYTWTPAGSLSNANIPNPVASPVVTTTYVVSGSNGTCDDQENVIVTVQIPQADAGLDVTICQGQSTSLNATGGVSYSWSPTTGLSNPIVANPVANPTVTTTYTVTVTDALGCTATDVITVTVNPAPVAGFTFTPQTAFIDSLFAFTDGSTGGAAWLWTFGDGDSAFTQNAVHAYSEAGQFLVCLYVISANGCIDTLCTTVEVLPRDVEIPNVFTPNGDNINDLLVFKNLEFFPNSHLVVYDRWGVKVYESDNYLNNWNGQRMGTGGDCSDGTYYYILSGPNLKEPITGFVTLIRAK